MYTRLSRGERVFMMYKTKEIVDDVLHKELEINGKLHNFVVDVIDNISEVEQFFMDMKIVLQSPSLLPYFSKNSTTCSSLYVDYL